MRHPHHSCGRVAQLTVVDDNAVVLRSLAADRRFFSAQLWFAAWGYSTPQQQALIATMPRVKTLESGAELRDVLRTDVERGV